MRRGCRRLGQGGERRVHPIRDLDQVSCGNGNPFGESARSIHADQVALCTEVLSSIKTMGAPATGNQRINHHSFAAKVALNDFPRCFMSQNQWRHTSWIVTKVGMHI